MPFQLYLAVTAGGAIGTAARYFISGLVADQFGGTFPWGTLIVNVTGSFIIESIFGIPGVGRYYITSIGQHDYGVLMAMTILYAFVVAFLNLVVDVLYAYIDPRIRYS